MDPYKLDKVSWTPKEKELVIKRFAKFTAHIILPSEEFMKATTNSSNFGVLAIAPPKIVTKKITRGASGVMEEVVTEKVITDNVTGDLIGKIY